MQLRLIKKAIKYAPIHLYTTLIKLYHRRLQVNADSLIYPTVKIKSNPGTKIIIESNCRIGCFPFQYSVGAWTKTRLICWKKGGAIKIGENTAINGANICSIDNISIGERCLIACGVNIMDYNAHKSLSHDRLREGGDIPKPINIGNNVWIGLNAIILKGTQIGDNSIVAAGSVVKGEFPEYSLIAGNPAKLIKVLDKSEFSE